MANTPSSIINLIADNLISNGIRICAIKAASLITMPQNDGDLRKLLKQILETPQNTIWLNSMLHYVIINNPKIDWSKFKSYSDEIVEEVTNACVEAINKISGGK